jgi:hypothetical protein
MRALDNLVRSFTMKPETILPIIAIAGVLMILAVIVSIPHAMTRADPIHIGNPHDFRPGPSIPSCSAAHQGPPDDPIKGCKITPKVAQKQHLLFSFSCIDMLSPPPNDSCIICYEYVSSFV